MIRILIVFVALIPFYGNAQDITIIPGDSIELSIENSFRGGLQWQISKNGKDWESIINATSNKYWFITDTSSYFRAVISEDSCESIYTVEKKVVARHILTMDMPDGNEFSVFRRDTFSCFRHFCEHLGKVYDLIP